ncbi:hypothetical protein ACI2K4_06670 [Micromonospora sp. NPDC050397]|uniref:phosphorylase family protein n=1 Tax=Micromonospora sp. NPDC050397 TaxID=3364279 RepID=UPI00384D683C
MSRKPSEKDVLALLALMRDEHDNDVLSIMLDDLVWSVAKLDHRFRARVLVHAAATVGTRRMTPTLAREVFQQLDDWPVERGSVDFAVVTVKDTEFDAAKVAFGIDLLSDSDHSWRGASFYEVTLERPGKRALKGVVTTCGEGGNQQMAAFLHTVLSVYTVRLCCLVGMAAGQEKEVDLGDVVFAERVTDYGLKITTTDGDQRELPQFTPDPAIRREMSSFHPERLGWHDDLAQQIAKAVERVPMLRMPQSFIPSEYRPRFFRKTILAADELIEDGSIRVRASTAGPARRTGALEMEGTGFARANQEAKVPWLVVRGIADFGHSDRSKDWQLVSTVAAASALRLWLRSCKFLADDAS